MIGSLAIGMPGWGWQVLDGAVPVMLGILVLAQWPSSGLWVIGLFLGIDLIVYGPSLTALALKIRAS